MKSLILLFLSFSLFSQTTISGGTTTATGGANFSLVFIGDPHLNFAGQPATWTAQAAWIAANQALYNIQGVFCMGDLIVSNAATFWTDGWSTIAGLGVPSV